MKKAVFWLLSFLIVFVCGCKRSLETNSSSVSLSKTICEENAFTYEFDETEGFYSICGFEGGLEEIAIPETYKGIPVKKIEKYAFQNAYAIKKIQIPSTITEIEEWAFFGCNFLTEFVVSEENEAYSDLDGNLYDRDKKVLMSYALGKSEKSFRLPQGVVTVSMGAFGDCGNLLKIIFPKSIQKIEKYAFLGGNRVTSVVFQKSGVWKAEEYEISWEYLENPFQAAIQIKIYNAYTWEKC